MKPAKITFKNERISQKLEIQFLTSTFGGGTITNEAGQGSQFKNADPETPIRVPSIRGQLRFWWRATSGAWSGSLEEMREREQKIFGSTSTPSSLSVSVDAGKVIPQPREIYETNSGQTSIKSKRGSEGLCYGAFSLTPQNKDIEKNHKKPGSLNDLTNAPWDLHLSFTSEYAADLELALAAWIAFGGIGGRTTRGFGQIAITKAQSVISVSEILSKVSAKGSPFLGAIVPAIDPTNLVRFRSNQSGDDLLNEALSVFSAFRQGSDIARDPGPKPNQPKRSRWPEPDTIRDIQKRHSYGHKPVHEYAMVRCFPRAAFGMPIIFHFKDKKSGDPNDATLQPKGEKKERMRSPLQIAIGPDRTVTFLVLTAPRPTEVELKDEKQNITHQLSEGDRARLATRAPQVFTDTDPLKAFFNFVRQQKHDFIIH